MRTAFNLLSVAILLSGLALSQTSTQNAPAVDTHFTVPANQFQDSPFAVSEGASDVRLFGTFKATGGRASLITVLVMTDDQYAQWQQHKVKGPGTSDNGGALYNSGAVSQGTINLRLPDSPANYHLVFNNTHFQYPKSIEADLTWQWAEAPAPAPAQ
jgi:hypothetical protein